MSFWNAEMFPVAKEKQYYVSFFSKCVCMCVQLVAHSCLTLWYPWTTVHQAPLSMGFSRQEYWSGLPCPPPGGLPLRRIVPGSPALQADSLPFEPPGKPKWKHISIQLIIKRWKDIIHVLICLSSWFLWKVTVLC